MFDKPLPVVALAFLAMFAGISVGMAQHSTRIEDVEVVAVQPVPTPTRAELLGRMHPVLVHFPIAWVLLLGLLEAGTLLTGRDQLTGVRLVLLVLVCLSFLPAGITGFLRAAYMGNDAGVRALMVPHRNMNIAAAVACATALMLCVAVREPFRRKARWLYLGLIGLACYWLWQPATWVGSSSSDQRISRFDHRFVQLRSEKWFTKL